MPIAVQAALLLILSNIFMTYAWYGHLRDLKDKLTQRLRALTNKEPHN